MKFLLLSLVMFMSLNVLAQDAETTKRKNHFNLSKAGLALEGYDVVSFFASKPVKGSEKFAHTHKGIKYQFSSQANLSTFKQNPDKYEPAYGGWCAYAFGAKGTKVEVDVKNYKIKNGRLFLFYRDFFGNTLNDWNNDEESLRTKADKNWTNTYK